MCDRSYSEFYSELDNWVKVEQNRYQTCRDVLNNALSKSCHSRIESAYLQIGPQISRNAPPNQTSRRIRQTQIRCELLLTLRLLNLESQIFYMINIFLN